MIHGKFKLGLSLWMGWRQQSLIIAAQKASWSKSSILSPSLEGSHGGVGVSSAFPSEQEEEC